MNEFSNETSGQGARTRAGLRRHMHHHRNHRVGGCGSDARRDAGHRQRGERIHALREFHHALGNVARSGNEQLRDEAAQIVAEATARLNGLLGAQQ